jgi:hypothetical protein
LRRVLADQFQGGQGHGLPLAAVRLFVTEGDLAVFEGHEAVVGEGNAVDLGGEIFQDPLPVSSRLAVNDPILFPDLGRDVIEESGFFQSVPECGAEEDSKSFHRDEEALTGREPWAVVWREATAGDDTMDVRVIAEIAGPSL